MGTGITSQESLVSGGRGSASEDYAEGLEGAMGLPQPKHAGYTLEDRKSWDGRWELIDGVAYDMTPAPGTEHREISSNLHAAIWKALQEARQRTGGGECKVFAAPTDVYLGTSVVQPDLLIVCDPSKISPWASKARWISWWRS
jgi:Uma2 family endonuclease